VIDLIKNGRNVDVTSANVFNYVALMIDYKINRQVPRFLVILTPPHRSSAKRKPSSPASPFAPHPPCLNPHPPLPDQEVISPAVLRLFNSSELDRLICGERGGVIDVDDLAANTSYSNCDATHPTIVKFWKVVKAFSQPQLQQLLQFVTSTSRVGRGWEGGCNVAAAGAGVQVSQP
jgi:hypothetical protein